MPDHGKIIEVTQAGQLWLVTLERWVQPNYVVRFDNTTMQIMYEGVTGDDFLKDLLEGGPEKIRENLLTRQVVTAGGPKTPRTKN